MSKYAQMTWNEIWMRPVSRQVAEEFEYYQERFEFIVQDLEQFSGKNAVLLEGAAYLPELLSLNKANPQKVIFLVPTKNFQIQHYSKRPWIKHILKECDHPEKAFENWMMRDHLFGQKIIRQARDRNFQTILVDGKQSIDAQYEQVKQLLGLK